MISELIEFILSSIIPLYYVGVFVVAVFILLEGKSPQKTQSYLLMVLLLPVVGIVIYLVFGQKLRKRKIFNKRSFINSAFGEAYLEKNYEISSEPLLPADSILHPFEKLVKFLHQDLSPITSNNRVKILRNGEEKFPELIEELRKAKHHIHIEYYIYTEDELGRQFSELLIQKAQEGVEVRLFVDGVGSFGLKRSFFKKMRAAGVSAYPYMPVLFPLLTSKINYRDHRKIVVIDGRVAFTGGINIDSRYLNNGKHTLYWRDTHLKIEGDAVNTLQLLFLLNWQFASGQNFQLNDSYFKNHPVEELVHTQINASGPDWELASIMDSFFLAINAAKKRIRIVTPYFIPSESIMNAILTSAKGGVEIEIMLPFKSDSWVVQAASLSFVAPLLRAGVRIYLYKKGFLHAKTMTVDDSFSIIGTANMDYRSFDLNHEVNTYFYDLEIAQILNSHFEEDKKDCVAIDATEWEDRVLTQKLLQSFCRLLAPIL